ncbi:hypothetical protein [Streptomyces sp. MBT62]|uniref:hypothetical protein n=1 Tax=Streptomyces sp. MBT62 TaxID=2800410 RepID=UPI00190B9E16|nr:hypothetical protein [Streptomyces sp. MBT62]MBK3568131.1 hypothetical protein [Streptomyces sp. MBT62]
MQQPPDPAGPLARLASLAGPPSAGGDILDWNDLSGRYPRGFPDDYKEFIRVYGEGLFDDFLGVVAPVSGVYPNDPGANVEGITGTAELTGEEEDYDAPELLRRFAAREISEDWTLDDLCYAGSRFFHDRDVRRSIQLRIDLWDTEVPPELRRASKSSRPESKVAPWRCTWMEVPAR